jgi:hypothetical protein
MSYISKEMKSVRMPNIKAVLKKYDMKGTVSIPNNSKIVVTLTSGKVNIGENVNVYNIDYNFKGVAKDFLNELVAAMKGSDWYDNSEVNSDYFDVAFYYGIDVGRWPKKFVLTE